MKKRAVIIEEKRETTQEKHKLRSREKSEEGNNRFKKNTVRISTLVLVLLFLYCYEDLLDG